MIAALNNTNAFDKTLFAACVLAASLHLGAAEPAWTGYRGPDGTGVFTDAKPLISPAIKWQVPVANHGNGSPLVIGNRVLVISEPGWKHDFPLLQCFDVATGKLLWEQLLDHLSATGKPPAEQVPP